MTAIAEPVGRTHPLWFGRVVLGRKRWHRQMELRRKLATQSKVLVYSANGVGKTFELGGFVIEYVLSKPGSRVICSGPKFEGIRRGLWQEVRRAFFSAAVPLPGRMGEHDWVLDDGWDASVATADQPSGLQSQRGQRTCVIIDEAQGFDSRDMWDALASLCTGAESLIVASGNPLSTSGRFAEAAHDPALGWQVMQIDGLEHPNVVEGREVIPGSITREWIADRLKDWGSEQDPRYLARVRGRFPEQGTNQLISAAWFDAAHKPVPELAGPRIGLDVARFGDDKCVLVVLADGLLVHEESWGHTALHETAARLIAAAKQWQVPAWRVKVDVTGLGAGVVDECARVGLAVDAVDFGAGPQGDWPELTSGMDIKNRRAELHWIGARLIERGAVSIPKQHAAARHDLAQPRFEFPNGVFRIEEKEKIKARIGHSPDHGDAVLIALSNVGNAGCGVTRVRMRQW